MKGLKYSDPIRRKIFVPDIWKDQMYFLDEEAVCNICFSIADGEATQKQMAEVYDVSVSVIRRICQAQIENGCCDG